MFKKPPLEGFRDAEVAPPVTPWGPRPATWLAMLLPLQEHLRKDTIVLHLIADFILSSGVFDLLSSVFDVVSWED